MWNFLTHFMGPYGMVASGSNMPNNTVEDMDALQKAFHEAHAKRVAKAGSFGPQQPAQSPPVPQAAPTGPLANPASWGLGPFAMSVAPGSSWIDSTKAPTNLMPSAPPVSTPTHTAVVPLPQARPAEADVSTTPTPSQPDTGFFMRNALSMRDPGTGNYIDPMGAQSIRGPDLIAKMIDVLHQKATG